MFEVAKNLHDSAINFLLHSHKSFLWFIPFCTILYTLLLSYMYFLMVSSPFFSPPSPLEAFLLFMQNSPTTLSFSSSSPSFSPLPLPLFLQRTLFFLPLHTHNRLLSHYPFYSGSPFFCVYENSNHLHMGT